MTEPKYQEFSKQEIPVEIRDENCSIVVIAGETKQGTKGVINNDLVAEDFNAFVYVVDGEISILEHENKVFYDNKKPFKKGELIVLGKGSAMGVYAQQASQFLLIAKPINEPMVRGGFFVMNTKQEIQQTFDDYWRGRLAE